MGIELKSIGEMIDQLSVTNIKCFMAQETVMKSADEHEIAVASKNAQILNKRRNELINAIDEYMQDKNSPTGKTY